MSYDDAYKAMLLNRGGSVNNSDIKNSKDSINRKFKSDPSYKLATLRKRDNNIDDSDLDTRIINVDTNTKKKKIYVRPDTNIEVGDYIIYPNKTYLALEVEDNLISPNASVEECNHLVKWMDKGVLNEILSIAENNTKYTEGIKTNVSGITEISAMFNLKIPNTPITRTLQEGQRIILNGNAWRMTQVDFVTTEGLLSITLGKDSINSEVDDVENEIANYYEHSYTITLSSTSQTLVETETYKITPTITDKGVVVSNPNNIIYASSDNNVATIDNNGLVTALTVGNCIITATVGSVSATLNLVVNAKPSVPVISYSCDWSTSKTATGTLLKTYVSSTATLTKTIDSVSSPLVVNYTLDSLGNTLLNANNISIIKKSDYSYQIKNINCTTVKNFVITFTDNSDSTIITTQTINLIGM